MTISVEILDEVATIRVVGKFNYHLTSEFKFAYTSIRQPVSKFKIDLQETQMLDSAALGLLIEMRNNLGDVEIDIDNSSRVVRRILQTSRMDQKFTIN